MVKCQPHNHVSDSTKVIVSKAMNKLKEEALVTNLPTQNLVANVCTFIPEVALLIKYEKNCFQMS